jgi:hypothetical protein
MGAEVFVVETRARIGEMLLAQARFDEALVLAEAALQQAGGADAAVARTMLSRIRGICLAHRGQGAEARASLISSVQTAESCGAAFELAVSLRALAYVEHLVGHPRAPERLAASQAVLSRLDVLHLGTFRMCEGDVGSTAEKGAAAVG